MSLIAGVDSSTQATKVELRDAQTGALVARGRAPHPPTSSPRSEQDPESWWAALEVARDEAGHRSEVAAISVAAQQHGMVVVDADDRVIRAAKLWNDTESAPDSDWLLGQLDGGSKDWADACGSVPLAAFTITKLSWLHRSEPDAWSRVDKVMLPHDWLAWRLTGEFATDRGDASGTGYWSPITDDYRYDLLRVIDAEKDWQRALPPVQVPNNAHGTGDNMAAALGIGLRPGDVAISLGTSGTVFAVSGVPTCDATGLVAGFADATGHFLPLVCTLNAMKATDAIGRLLGVDHETFDALALSAVPGAGGVTLLPYMDGERTPNLPNSTGVLSGLRSDVSREQIARAAVEGVICGLLEGLDALRAAGVECDDGRLFLVGGGKKSTAFRRVLADLSGREVTVPLDDELVAIGACVQAAARNSGETVRSVQDAWGLGDGEVIAPDISVDAEAVRTAYASVASGAARKVPGS